ncbi:MAG: DUF4325 domain-containing protein [Verrucomicrobiaceae bacterium]|nr:MAG: DUF4325 domain-containing protein [Verrucomicrobiaceae bacterium]
MPNNDDYRREREKRFPSGSSDDSSDHPPPPWKDSIRDDDYDLSSSINSAIRAAAVPILSALFLLNREEELTLFNIVVAAISLYVIIFCFQHIEAYLERRWLRFEVAKQFGAFPGGIFKESGEYSAEEFREKYVETLIQLRVPTTFNFTGVHTVAPSFLEAAFGKYMEEMGRKKFDKFVRITADDDLDLLNDVANLRRKYFRP